MEFYNLYYGLDNFKMTLRLLSRRYLSRKIVQSLVICTGEGILPLRFCLLLRRKRMIYELRTYQVVPGKMKNLNDRFANITVPLFEKHGMKVIGFWETAIGEATTTELIYMLAFEDLGHYQRAWDAFIADPEWQAAKRLTEVGGPLVNVASSKIIEPTDYSPLQ